MKRLRIDDWEERVAERRAQRLAKLAEEATRRDAEFVDWLWHHVRVIAPLLWDELPGDVRALILPLALHLVTLRMVVRVDELGPLPRQPVRHVALTKWDALQAMLVQPDCKLIGLVGIVPRRSCFDAVPLRAQEDWLRLLDASRPGDVLHLCYTLQRRGEYED
jgi:hypothetical protein